MKRVRGRISLGFFNRGHGKFEPGILRLGKEVTFQPLLWVDRHPVDNHFPVEKGLFCCSTGRSQLSDVIARGRSTYGSQTFDQSLFGLYKGNLITYEDALKYSSNPDDFALRASGVVSSSDTY